jgi:hypothetical protein
VMDAPELMSTTVLGRSLAFPDTVLSN